MNLNHDEIIYFSVEYYDGKNLMLDFLEEKDFIYYKHNGDYLSSMRLSLERYEPTMLFFSQCVGLEIKQDDVIAITKKILLQHKMRNHNAIEKQEKPATVYAYYEDGEWLGELFRNGHAKKRNKRDGEDKKVESTVLWNRDLVKDINDYWKNEMVVEIVNVGQGSTNIIRTKEHIMYFDIGTDYKATKKELKARINYVLPDNTDQILLIISHWHVDHYNYLTVLDDNQWKKFKIAILPCHPTNVTTKQIFYQIVRFNIANSVCFSPWKTGKKVGIKEVCSIPNRFSLYIGEKSSDCNYSGLAMVLETLQSITIFGADHNNYQVWNCIYEQRKKYRCQVVNVVVPHHGGFVGDMSVNIGLPHISGFAVVSVGDNTYGHPCATTLQQYVQKGFWVRETQKEKSSILIFMR